MKLKCLPSPTPLPTPPPRVTQIFICIYTHNSLTTSAIYAIENFLYFLESINARCVCEPTVALTAPRDLPSTGKYEGKNAPFSFRSYHKSRTPHILITFH